MDSRIVTVALVIILFNGGMSLGWRRLRPALGPVLWLGIAGTVATAGVLAVAAHWLFGFDWQSSLLLGTALAPTDPAVVFSVLGAQEIAGRSGTILEGESGANDPVGIALLVSVLGASGGGTDAWTGLAQFALQMAVGVVVGLATGFALRWTVRRIPLPSEQLYPIRVIAGAAATYGLATVAHGSGFLAVLLAGVLLGDVEAPFQPEVERFTAALASLGEIVAFTVLGLSIHLFSLLTSADLLIGFAIAALLIVVIRPVFVGALLAPVRLHRSGRPLVLSAERGFNVPMLLGLFVRARGCPDAVQLSWVVFVVGEVSVVVEGVSVPRR